MAKAIARPFSPMATDLRCENKLYNFACAASWIFLINGVTELELVRVAREEQVML
jgi:hypothetical protein